MLAQNIVIARKRRKETQAQWAQRLGVSQPTMARIERGDPSVSMASYVMCMWLINQAQGLADLIAPQNDLTSLEQEVARARPRPRPNARATAQKLAKASHTTSTKTATETQAVALPPASKVNAPIHPRASHLVREERSFPGIDQANAAMRAALMAAGLGHEEQIKKAMQMATGLGSEEEMARTLGIAGLGAPERLPNSTAAGLAALIAGQKKARP
ncbi:helix-turn-helix transcriptional regulator [Acidovorax sp. 69]|uniref:helix-turn-helix transcriptional regulator n=1 Tax=Acidovorax sp. 69 TaxID=2035202 RepID=UPI001E3EA26F|nr:helix-turn-helix transcriptional regulator [Acidovorax sp. 69]